MALVLDGGANTITNLVINSANITDGSIVNADINASAAIASSKIAGGLGKILQVVSVTKTDTQSFLSTSFADISGLSASITLSNSSNKVFILANIYTSKGSVAEIINFVRDSTNIAQPSGSATREATLFGYNSNTLNMQTQSMSFLDTPGDTNAHTYKLQLKGTNTNAYIYVNRYFGSNDYYGISTLTLMEVAA
tara:strand:- start:48 stop:629 length:582 start_codon:yes stop_codon:yes gene_type:complete